MKCYICNRDDDSISWDSRHKDYSPCFTCQAVINSLIYEDTDDDVFPVEEEEENAVNVG